MYLQHFFQSLWAIINEMSPYILLGFLIAGLLHVFVKPSAMSRHLAGGGLKPVVKAALFGIPLPLCSCGVLPTAVALRRQGASKGATTSFLIATPQTGVDSIAATYSLLGLPFAILRPVAALAGAALGGAAVDRFASRPDGETDTVAGDSCGVPADDEYRGMSFGRKLVEAVRYGLVDMVASVGKWLVIGLIVAALITVLVPDQLFVSLSRYPLLAMGVMILVAVPMYVCATGSIPIALSLMLKGLSPGVAFCAAHGRPGSQFCLSDDTLAHHGSACHTDICRLGSGHGHRIRSACRSALAGLVVYPCVVYGNGLSRSRPCVGFRHSLLGGARRSANLYGHKISWPHSLA